MRSVTRNLPRLCFFVGELQSQHSDVYDNFFDDGGLPKCHDEVVVRIEGKLTAHLSHLGKGAPRLPASERAVAARASEAWGKRGNRSNTW